MPVRERLVVQVCLEARQHLRPVLEIRIDANERIETVAYPQMMATKVEKERRCLRQTMPCQKTKKDLPAYISKEIIGDIGRNKPVLVQDF